MSNLEQIFMGMVQGVKDKDPRYKILDCEHVMDTVKGIEYHLENGETWTITQGSDKVKILDGTQITEAEANILGHIAGELPKLYADMKREIFLNLMSESVVVKPPVPRGTPERYSP
jgi:hypothetical protein